MRKSGSWDPPELPHRAGAVLGAAVEVGCRQTLLVQFVAHQPEQRRELRKDQRLVPSAYFLNAPDEDLELGRGRVWLVRFDERRVACRLAQA